MIKLNCCLEKVNFYNNDFNSMENLMKILRVKKMNFVAKSAEKLSQANANAPAIAIATANSNVNNFEFENIKSGEFANYFIYEFFF